MSSLLSKADISIRNRTFSFRTSKIDAKRYHHDTKSISSPSATSYHLLENGRFTVVDGAKGL